MRYRKRSKRSYRRDCRKRYNKKTRQCKTRSKNKSKTKSRNYKKRYHRKITMRGGINIPNKLPYTISQTPDAEFSKSIYYPRLPKVTPIPVRQSQDFFGQDGPVPSEHNALYTKLNTMNGGEKKSPSASWFAQSRYGEFANEVDDSTELASSHQKPIKKQNVVIQV